MTLLESPPNSPTLTMTPEAAPLRKWTPKPMYWPTFDREKVEAMPDAELIAEMKKASSVFWVDNLSPTRILSLLKDEFSATDPIFPTDGKEKLRRRLACLLLKERHSSDPFHAARAAKQGDRYWMSLQAAGYLL